MIRITLTAAIIAFGFAASAQQGQSGSHFIENWDLDEDGQVSLAEATERRSDVFASFDSDDNGVLSPGEYDLFDEARANDMKENGQGQGKGKGNPANGMRRQFTDTNGDGMVSEGEFMGSVPAWFERMDKNGDGVVTVADFGKRGG